MRFLTLIVVGCCIAGANATAEQFLRNGTEWAAIDGSLAEFVSKGHKLVYVEDSERMVTYYLQGDTDLIRCNQEFSPEMKMNGFGCAKAIPPTAIEKP